MNFLKDTIMGLFIAVAVTVCLLVIASHAKANPTDWHNNTISEQISQKMKAERCEERGGVWLHNHCSPRNMTKSEEDYARRYVALKQMELREIKK